MGHQRDYSEEIAGVVDEEVRKLIEDAHDEAWHVINDNRDVLDRLVLELLEKETLDTSRARRDVRGRSSSGRCARPGCPASAAP